MKIFLWGMPGSGKSTIGKKLARMLGLPFIDLDKIIEIHEGKSIPMVFADQGETYFRAIEKKLLLESIDNHKDFVMATGGGAPCFFDNLQQMKNAGITVFLNKPLAHIAQKMSKKGIAKRPLLSGIEEDNLEKELAVRFQHRLAFYQQAHFEIREDDLHPTHIASIITSKSTKN